MKRSVWLSVLLSIQALLDETLYAIFNSSASTFFWAGLKTFF
jgi:hypothetical protein